MGSLDDVRVQIFDVGALLCCDINKIREVIPKAKKEVTRALGTENIISRSTCQHQLVLVLVNEDSRFRRAWYIFQFSQKTNQQEIPITPNRLVTLQALEQLKHVVARRKMVNLYVRELLLEPRHVEGRGVDGKALGRLTIGTLKAVDGVQCANSEVKDRRSHQSKAKTRGTDGRGP